MAHKVADAHEKLDEIVRSHPLEVELVTARLERPVFRLLKHATTRGVPSVLLRLSGAACLRPAALERLAPWRRILSVELVFDTLPEEGPPSPNAWTLSQLIRSLKCLETIGMQARVRFEVNAETSGALPELAKLAAAAVAHGRQPLTVWQPAIAYSLARGRHPASFTQLASLLQMAKTASKLMAIRSEEGTPLCFFGSRGHGSPGTEETYSPECAKCPMRSACGGVSKTYANHFGIEELRPPGKDTPKAAPLPDTLAPTIGWANQARVLLTDRPRERLALRDILPREEHPRWPCVLPWYRLERNTKGAYGPCCPDYLSVRKTVRSGVDPASLWNSKHMQKIRRAMTQGKRPKTCRDWCPVLLGGKHRAGDLIFRGGPAVVVENQIRLVADMLAGATEVRSVPLELCLAVTSHCNYDCIMCRVEGKGTSDQLDADFYSGLESWLDRVLVFDGSGGEPMASSTFREFLRNTDFEGYPQLRIHLTTNGSYFTPSQLDRYLHVPFSSLTISLNAATAETYLDVNHGLPWARIRENLDALLQAKSEGRLSCAIRYSMVIIKRNLDEVVPFAELAAQDGVGVRYLLPTKNRKRQSIMKKPELMSEALNALQRVRGMLVATGDQDDIGELDSVMKVLTKRAESRVYKAL